MTLTQFIKRPAIREAFKEFGTQERTPHALRGRAPLVPGTGGHAGSVGTAFDYLARFHLARELRGSPVKIVEREWIAERTEEHSAWRCRVPQEDRQRWREILARTRDEARTYISGSNNLQNLADCSQYLAQLDNFYRSGVIDHAFRPLSKVSDELVQLVELFDPVTRFSPKRHCFLNPKFVAPAEVGGADADLVIDDRLVELKTSAKLDVKLDQLLQLAGYAALQQMTGISYQDFTHKDEFQGVEIYYARYGESVRWSVGELFPDDGFDRFCKVFEAEITNGELIPPSGI